MLILIIIVILILIVIVIIILILIATMIKCIVIGDAVVANTETESK